MKPLLSTIRPSPATQFLLFLWLVSVVYLAFQGYTLQLALATASFVFWGAHTWFSVHNLDSSQDESESIPTSPGQLWLQVGVILLFAIIANQPLPLWGAMIEGLRRVGEQTLPVEWVGGPGNAVANPTQYFVLPLLVLSLLGAKPSQLGLQRGVGSWRVAGIWLLIPTITWVVLLALGQLPAQTLARRLIGNSLQNGFFEEFLFRGALQSRLSKLLPANWTLVIQALLFGLWHIQANLGMFEGNLLGALAWCIASQTTIGLLFGILFQRTRSLIAPSVAHVVSNAFGQSFG